VAARQLVGLRGQRFDSNLCCRSHTKLAAAEDGRSRFPQSPMILVPPSSVEADLQNLHPLLAPFSKNSSLPRLPFEQIYEEVVLELLVNADNREGIRVG
jgi:hypothetical protein